MTTEKQKELNIGLGSEDKSRIIASLDGLNEVLRAREADDSSLQPLAPLLEHKNLEIRRAAL